MNSLQGSKKILLLTIALMSILTVTWFSYVVLSPTGTIPSPRPSPKASSLPQPYNLERLKEDFRRISNRQSLSTTDQAIRDKLTKKLNNKSGVLEDNNSFKIEYVSAPNSFMVEIKGSTTDQSKKEAENWFKQKGLSNQGVCNLPVVFYLAPESAEALRRDDRQFDPVPDGCG